MIGLGPQARVGQQGFERQRPVATDPLPDYPAVDAGVRAPRPMMLVD